MSRSEKPAKRVERQERELRDLLVPALQAVAAGRTTVLFLDPADFHRYASNDLRSAERVAILALAEDTRRIATQLGIDQSGLLASRVLDAFAAANDRGNQQRLGPIRFAQQLLKDLGESPR